MKDLVLSLLRFFISDFVSLAMYRGHSDDARLSSGAPSPTPPPFLLHKQMSRYISDYAGHDDELKVCL